MSQPIFRPRDARRGKLHLSLARALRSRLGPEKLETLFFPGECHGECAYANQLAAHEATAAFLARHLL